MMQVKIHINILNSAILTDQLSSLIVTKVNPLNEVNPKICNYLQSRLHSTTCVNILLAFFHILDVNNLGKRNSFRQIQF